MLTFARGGDEDDGGDSNAGECLNDEPAGDERVYLLAGGIANILRTSIYTAASTEKTDSEETRRDNSVQTRITNMNVERQTD